MAFTAGLAALATLVSPAIAAPAAAQGFTIAQLNTGNQKFLSGPLAVQATYLKYNKPVPANIQAAAAEAAKQRGSIVANPEIYDSEYLSPVFIGKPPQAVMMDFDTGSSDLWTYSSQQPANQLQGHSYYTPGSSTTSKLDQGESWSIMYGDGSGARGNVYYDKVVVGGVTATSQAVECATSVSSSFVADTNSDGIFGLAFPKLNTGTPTQLKPWFNNVRPSLPSPIFAASLRKGAPGFYDFGYINSSRYTGDLTYAPVNNGRGFWEFTTTAYKVGPQRTNANIQAIADTGTTLIYLPNAVVSKYYAKVQGSQNSASSGGYVFPCSSKLPNFSIKIGNAFHKVPGSYLNYAPVSSTLCYGGIQNSAGLGVNILGDAFLKSQYVVFDQGVPRIGFAAQSGA